MRSGKAERPDTLHDTSRKQEACVVCQSCTAKIEGVKFLK